MADAEVAVHVSSEGFQALAANAKRAEEGLRELGAASRHMGGNTTSQQRIA